MGVWSGSCHCGAVRFRVEGEIKETIRCGCSLCRRKGAEMATVHESALIIEAGEDNLSLYRWNTGVARHYFCRTCGIYPFHKKRSMPDHYGVNVGCLDNFEAPAGTPYRWSEGTDMSVRPGGRADWTGPPDD